MHVGMKLAVCGTLKDDEVGEENIVDYLLFALNKAGNFSYLNYMNIEDHGPQDNSKLMLAKAKEYSLRIKKKHKDSLLNGAITKPAMVFINLRAATTKLHT